MSSQTQINNIEMKGLDEALDYFKSVGGKTKDVVRVALNKTATRTKPQISKTIRAEIRLAAKYVNDRLDLRRATNKNLIARIATPSRGLLLSRFSTDPLIAGGSDKASWIKPPPVPKQGIRVRVKPGGTIYTFRGDDETVGQPFYMVLQDSRALAIVARRKKPGKKDGMIKVFYGPSLSQAFRTKMDGTIAPAASLRLEVEMTDAVRYLLTKMKVPSEDVI